ncbi:MAG: hypothetical protein GW949_09565 [Spirochaetales bacterium]|nr:hypothetical protein [Spirochaetales bacterium]
MSILNDQYKEGEPGGPLKDICPFTVFGIFNRGLTDDNRKNIGLKLASFLGVSEAVPDSFEGIPVINNQRTWFFGYAYRREPNDIENLWEMFARALEYSDTDNTKARSEFLRIYDATAKQWGIGWNLTMGLYWIRPWNYPTLDGQSQSYIKNKLKLQIGLNGFKGRCSGKDYLILLETLETRFQEEGYPVYSFPELSLSSWLYKESGTSVHPMATDPDYLEDSEETPSVDEIDADLKNLIPKFDDLMIPLLRKLQDGQDHLSKDIYNALKADLKLEKFDVITLESTGLPLFDNRAAWAKSYLKRAGLVDLPTRGFVRVRDRGKDFLAQSDTKISQFTRFTDFFSYSVE